MARPFRQKGVVELKRLVRESQDKSKILEAIAEELQHRKTQRANALADRVRGLLDVAGEQAIGESSASDVGPRRGRPETGLVPENQTEGPPELEPEPPASEFATAEQEPLTNGTAADGTKPKFDDADLDDRPITGAMPPDPPEEGGTPGNDPTAILDLWTALEVLSPQTYLQPRDLADGDVRRIAHFGDGRALPWVGGTEKARPKTKLYYQVVLGAIPMDHASAVLLKAFGDKRPERSAARGYAALAAVTVDREGRPVAEKPVAVSSFGWGFSQARLGRLAELKTWPQVERRIVEGLEVRLKREEDDEVLPLDARTILNAFRWLSAQAGLSEDDSVAPSFAIRLYRWFQASGDPEPMLLNSFFLEDLARGRGLLAGNQLGSALAGYLGIEAPEGPVDFLEDKVALEAVLAPSRTPAARWPTPDGHPLVLLQQAAVNVAFARLAPTSGILGVNGPPGTGKTTLLRDLVAGVVLERARALAAFDDPEEAFKHQGKIRRGQAFIHLYELAGAIRGHELLVASSNNKAVENVSRELPGRREIEASLTPRYFPTIAAAVAGKDREAWGLIAGILGNAANRVAFRRDFWADPDTGMRAYLWAAAGNESKVERKDPDTGEITTTIARVVAEEKPPRDKQDALTRWRRARREFDRIIKDAEKALQELEGIREAIRQHTALKKQRPQIEQRVRGAAGALEAGRTTQDLARRLAEAVADERRHAELAECKHRASRPGLFSRLFRRANWRDWTATMAALERRHREAIRELTTAQGRQEEAQRHCATLASSLARAEVELAYIDTELTRLERNLTQLRSLLKRHFADEEFWRARHVELQTSTPWLMAHVQRLRDLCFGSALELHRAFIDVAAKPIRNNLNALFGVLMGDGLDATTQRLLPSLWSTLFLVVPVISTTFASVGRMLGAMPPESFGWLLVDEAGQAVPQAAVGAIMRARRAVIVGDPLQIEPIVTLPLPLVERIARRMSVDPDTWTAPRASAQTLADTASQYQSWIEQLEGAVRVGLPLLVHRRCSQPMFGISNAVAYAGKMVQAKQPKPSPVRDVLGPSQWLNVSGTGSGKWCPAEGKVIIEALDQLVRQGLDNPDIFVITPFRIVAQNMREMLAASDVVRQIDVQPRRWARDRVGTVHTFQGREAEAVFLVLGAPDASQSGARNWAGHPPNLANVAVSRAKEALYVVGNRELWRGHGSFRTVSEKLVGHAAE